MSSNLPDSDVTISLRVDRLRAARERLGLTQHQLARICGISLNQISRYEIGMTEPLALVLARIAHTLDISVDYLLGLSDSPQNISLKELAPEKRKLLDAFELGDSVAILELVAARLRDLRDAKSAGEEKP